MLWITFKSCIFAFWNNQKVVKGFCHFVVNYIQILYLCILKQRQLYIQNRKLCCELHSNLVSLHSETTMICKISMSYSCELHSNLVSLHSETTKKNAPASLRRLWITFKSCIFAFWNNFRKQKKYLYPVVNYIQILYLCILKQRKILYYISIEGCELHSNLVSLHSETTISPSASTTIELWITFKSCIFAFWNNFIKNCWCHNHVVNYIQILYLCILKQQSRMLYHLLLCCELHSNLVSLHSETTNTRPWQGDECCELHSNLVSLHSETT